jgi:hypothetical protein
MAWAMSWLASGFLYLAASSEGIEAFNFAHLYDARFG